MSINLKRFFFLGVTFATVWACFLPAVSHSLYFHVDDEKTDVFSKAVIHNPNTPKYSTEKVEPQNVSLILVLFFDVSLTFYFSNIPNVD